MDNNRQSTLKFYHSTATITWNGEVVKGQQGIEAVMKYIPSSVHTLFSLDAQASGMQQQQELNKLISHEIYSHTVTFLSHFYICFSLTLLHLFHFHIFLHLFLFHIVLHLFLSHVIYTETDVTVENVGTYTNIIVCVMGEVTYAADISTRRTFHQVFLLTASREAQIVCTILSDTFRWLQPILTDFQLKPPKPNNPNRQIQPDHGDKRPNRPNRLNRRNPFGSSRGRRAQTPRDGVQQ